MIYSTRTIRVLLILNFAAILFGFCEPSRAGDPKKFQSTRIRMGIPFNITVYAEDAPTANAAMGQAFQRIKTLNLIFSDYDPRSEVRKLTADIAPGQAVPISNDLSYLLDHSLELSKQTDGAFDVTISPVVKLWRRSYRTHLRPSTTDLQAALKRTGWKNIHVDTEQKTVTFDKSNMELDFGGIAKGYACDEALKILKSHGLNSAMVEAGGDLACGDPPPGAAGWIIAIAPLTQAENKQVDHICVANQGVATSGDAYQFIELDGVRHSHIVNPKTGVGLTTRSSVTIIAPNGTDADAYASAFSVIGPDRALDFAKQLNDVELLMEYVGGADEELKQIQSKGFAEYVIQGKKP